MDFSEGFCTEKNLHPQNSQRGVQAEDPAQNLKKKKKKKKKKKTAATQPMQLQYLQQFIKKKYIVEFILGCLH